MTQRKGNAMEQVSTSSDASTSEDEDLKWQHRVKRKFRAVITDVGREKLRLLARKRKQPIFIRLLDTYTFTMAVILAVFTEYVMFVHTNYFPLEYAILIPVLYVSKLAYYTTKKWQWFLIDFCYFTNFFCLLQVLAFPNNATLLKINFLFANGPVAWAVPLWKNSLVFHDIDKMSSVCVHIMPMLLQYVLRWSAAGPAGETSLGLQEVALATAVYMVWQFFYLLVTEVIFQYKLNADPELSTSLRWLASDPKNGMSQFVLKLCRKMGIMEITEMYDAKTWKTKLIFVTTQLVYTIATFALVPLLYYSYAANVCFIGFCLITGVHNGAVFYIEIFSRRYILEVEKKGASNSAEPQLSLIAPVITTAAGTPKNVGHSTIKCSDSTNRKAAKVRQGGKKHSP